MAFAFERISIEQLRKDWEKLGWPMTGENSLEDAAIIMPRRATSYSAGYDIFAPINIVLHPGESITIPTGLKIHIPIGYFLMIVPRSGLGFKYQIGLANTVGIIDADYYDNPDNEGHILVKLVNRGDKDCFINVGQAFCQGILMQHSFFIGESAANETRKGGIGSTDKE